MEQGQRDYYRGEIYYADLNNTVGHEQYGIRPVLILQNDVGNCYSPNVIVTVASKHISKKKHQPTHVTLDGIEGMDGKSQFQLETIYTVDKRRLRQYVGKLTDTQMDKIDAALRVSLYLSEDDYLPTEVEAP